MKIEPVNATILIKMPKAKEVSAGGIVLPGKGESVQSRGTVVAVCEGSECKIGDKILFPEYEGSIIMDGEVKYVLIKEKKILAKYTEGESNGN